MALKKKNGFRSNFRSAYTKFHGVRLQIWAGKAFGLLSKPGEESREGQGEEGGDGMSGQSRRPGLPYEMECHLLPTFLGRRMSFTADYPVSRLSPALK